MNSLQFPVIFPFITVRLERFGALIFNPYTGVEEEVGRVEAFILNQCRGELSVEQIVDKIIYKFGYSRKKSQKEVDHLLNKLIGLFALEMVNEPSDEVVLEEIMPMYFEDGPYYMTPKSAIWNITHKCNLNCQHCLTSSGEKSSNELSTEKAKVLIDQLAKAKVLNLSLSGGEPFMHPDIMEILTYACHTKMRVDIATNGSILTDELLAGLKELPIFQIQVSIDGLEAVHDEFRGKKGAFKASCDNIKKLLDNDIAVNISTTVNKKNIDTLEEIIDLSAQLNATGFKAIPFVSVGRATLHDELGLSKEEHRRMHMILEKCHDKYENKMFVSSESSFSCLLSGEAPSDKNRNIDGHMGCSAGHDTLSIGVDGRVYPCPFLQAFPFGNLLEQNLLYLWQTNEVLTKLRTISKSQMDEPCRTCKYAPNHCKGGCRAAAYLQSGHLLGADPHCFLEEQEKRQEIYSL